VESGRRPDAVSPCGAIGVMQLMPATARALKVDPRDAEQNIQGGIHYDAMLWASWADVPDPAQRRMFMLASYNAGEGNIRKAQRLAGGARTWFEVAPWLARVTGRFAAETLHYVAKIHHLMGIE
jgi:membrane-bound lytic murein transglycosylase F